MRAALVLAGWMGGLPWVGGSGRSLPPPGPSGYSVCMNSALPATQCCFSPVLPPGGSTPSPTGSNITIFRVKSQILDETGCGPSLVHKPPGPQTLPPPRLPPQCLSNPHVLCPQDKPNPQVWVTRRPPHALEVTQGGPSQRIAGAGLGLVAPLQGPVPGAVCESCVPLGPCGLKPPCHGPPTLLTRSTLTPFALTRSSKPHP